MEDPKKPDFEPMLLKFRARGFTVSTESVDRGEKAGIYRFHHYITAKKEGIRVRASWQWTGNYWIADVNIRTAKGGYTKEGWGHIVNDNWWAECDKFKPVAVTDFSSREMPPEPYVFADREALVSDGNCTSRCHLIQWVRVMGIVTIQNGKASLSPHKPTERAWFLLDCEARSGATFNILSDGDHWYPVNRRSMRVNRELKPKDLSLIHI